MGCLQAKNKNIVLEPSTATSEKQPSSLPAIAGGDELEGKSLVSDDSLNRGNQTGVAGNNSVGRQTPSQMAQNSSKGASPLKQESHAEPEAPLPQEDDVLVQAVEPGSHDEPDQPSPLHSPHASPKQQIRVSINTSNRVQAEHQRTAVPREGTKVSTMASPEPVHVKPPLVPPKVDQPDQIYNAMAERDRLNFKRAKVSQQTTDRADAHNEAGSNRYRDIQENVTQIGLKPLKPLPPPASLIVSYEVKTIYEGPSRDQAIHPNRSSDIFSAARVSSDFRLQPSGLPSTGMISDPALLRNANKSHINSRPSLTGVSNSMETAVGMHSVAGSQMLGSHQPGLIQEDKEKMKQGIDIDELNQLLNLDYRNDSAFEDRLENMLSAKQAHTTGLNSLQNLNSPINGHQMASQTNMQIRIQNAATNEPEPAADTKKTTFTERHKIVPQQNTARASLAQSMTGVDEKDSSQQASAVDRYQQPREEAESASFAQKSQSGLQNLGQTLGGESMESGQFY